MFTGCLDYLIAITTGIDITLALTEFRICLLIRSVIFLGNALVISSH